MLDEKILAVLRNNRDTYISSEELCKIADISRAAVWKHIEKLREEGYDIEASPHHGYRLVEIPDSLIPAEIRWGLKARIIGREIISYKKTDSTNDVAYALGEKGAKEGTVVISEEQAKGKGRHGRHWESPAKGGVYFSFILRPTIAPSEIPIITLLSAVAVAKAIRQVAVLGALIKWPNDIMIEGQKACGILTEMKAEQDRVDFLVVGIGINVNTHQRDLPKGAISLKEALKKEGLGGSVSRLELIRKIFESIEREYNLLKKEGVSPIIEEWKHYSAMLGSRIKVMLHGRTFEGQAHDIDSDGALLVRLESGILERVSSGDIVMVR